MKSIGIFQLGLGKVGKSLVDLIIGNQHKWERLGWEVRYVALADSSGAIIPYSPYFSSEELMEIASYKLSGSKLADFGKCQFYDSLDVVESLPNYGLNVMIDCASGEHTLPVILKALEAGWHVLLSNKQPLAVGLGEYSRLARYSDHLWYEATVGAGLPIISTLRSLLDCGDSIDYIQGVFSGTLGFISSKISSGTTFSEALREAVNLGYTEPDPRDDLSGVDVARKALILARSLGRQIEMSDVKLSSFIPDLNYDESVEEFMSRIEDYDQYFEQLSVQAAQSKQVVKYVARVPVDGDVTVGLESLPASTVFGSVSGPDNVFVFSTRNYKYNPIVVIGPGAGPVRTAMGIASDLLNLMR